jgi:hypothetical protein
VIGRLEGEAYESSMGFFTGELSEGSLYFLESLTLLSSCSMRLMLMMYLLQLCMFYESNAAYLAGECGESYSRIRAGS